MTIGLYTPSVGFKPFRYPWAYQFWLDHQKQHWVHDEIPMGQDVKDWHTKLSDQERKFITQILRFFVQADIDVQKAYHVDFVPMFKPTEIRMALACIADRESVHLAAYSHIIETIGMPDEEYLAFLKTKEMHDKHMFNKELSTATREDTLVALSSYGAFIEGMQLFASFAMLLAFPATGLLNGVGQIVALSVKEESAHCDFLIKLAHTFEEERGFTPEVTERIKSEIYGRAEQAVALEDAFIDLAFGMAGEVRIAKQEEVKQYIRYVADARLGQLKLRPIFGVKEHPMPWLQQILNGVEFPNFFETKPSNYVKQSATGNWDDAYDV